VGAHSVGETASNAKHDRRNGRRCYEGLSGQFSFIVNVTWLRVNAFIDPNGVVGGSKGVAVDRCAAGVDEATYGPPSRLGEKRIGDRYVHSLELRVRNLVNMGGVKRCHVDDSLDSRDRRPANA
jgi:hypothetical protein